MQVIYLLRSRHSGYVRLQVVIKHSDQVEDKASGHVRKLCTLSRRQKTIIGFHTERLTCLRQAETANGTALIIVHIKHETLQQIRQSGRKDILTAYHIHVRDVVRSANCDSFCSRVSRHTLHQPDARARMRSF